MIQAPVTTDRLPISASTNHLTNDVIMTNQQTLTASVDEDPGVAAL